MAHYGFDDLLSIMATLRSPDGCPWDREQTQETLLPYLVEESRELMEAVQDGSDEDTCEELGDVLLQVVFHAQIAQERGAFSMKDVVDGIAAKLVRRHPHVFGEGAAEDAAAVVRQWDAIKKQEKGERRKSALDGVSRTMPALAEAHEVQKKAAKVGFDWPDTAGPHAKVEEELAEVVMASNEGDQQHLEEEVGDLLFAVVNLSRKLGIHPEVALMRANRKFARRFRAVESKAGAEGLKGRPLAELDAIWDEVKSEERG